VWSAEPAHEALVSRELLDRAAGIGRGTEGSRQGNGMNSHPLTKRTYLFRSHVRCTICGRRMIGHRGKGPTYYRCEARRDDPHILEEFPDHPRSVSVREDVLSAAVEAFFADRIFGEGRARLLAQHFSEAEACAHAEHAQRVANLEARIAAHEQTKRRLVREMATLPDDDDLAASMRGDLREEYYREERDRRAQVEELDQLRAQEPPPPEDPSLLEELPHIPVTLEGVPEELVRDLFAAFNLAVQYDRLRDEVQLSVTVTDSLATAIRHPYPDDGARAGAVVLPFPVPFAPTPFRNPPLFWDIWGTFGPSLRGCRRRLGVEGRWTHTLGRSPCLLLRWELDRTGSVSRSSSSRRSAGLRVSASARASAARASSPRPRRRSSSARAAWNRW
jgi:hypothetical protein